MVACVPFCDTTQNLCLKIRKILQRERLLRLFMKLYESLCILRPVQVETENERVIEKMKEVLTQAGANILKLDNSGKKKLAYDIQHERKGTYITVQFEGPPTVVLELERFQRMEDQVMKFMTVRLNPSDLVAVAEAEASGEDAGDGGNQFQ
ncbi:MAG: 30S ribosomal protein S6 [Nitrospirae bacterium CG_4_9_14_3_um_filter_51_5]|nr:MAG: 30S ribosomal protein S6 [Nitrospirae bacterium CG_4_9_14_3_um_filter_51_5]